MKKFLFIINPVWPFMAGQQFVSDNMIFRFIGLFFLLIAIGVNAILIYEWGKNDKTRI